MGPQCVLQHINLFILIFFSLEKYDLFSGIQFKNDCQFKEFENFVEF